MLKRGSRVGKSSKFKVFFLTRTQLVRYQIPAMTVVICQVAAQGRHYSVKNTLLLLQLSRTLLVKLVFFLALQKLADNTIFWPLSKLIPNRCVIYSAG